MRGMVERLVPAGGFGVVRSLDGDEYFFHVSAMNETDFDELAVGSYVDFSCGADPGDRTDELPRAVHVELAPGEMPAVDNEDLPPEKIGPS
jgi:cold shock CspA family protein